MRPRSTPKLAWCTSGFSKSGLNAKIVGRPTAAPVGGAVRIAGYTGICAPVKVMVCTLMPLFECAVPIMIAGVRP